MDYVEYLSPHYHHLWRLGYRPSWVGRYDESNLTTPTMAIMELPREDGTPKDQPSKQQQERLDLLRGSVVNAFDMALGKVNRLPVEGETWEPQGIYSRHGFYIKVTIEIKT